MDLALADTWTIQRLRRHREEAFEQPRFMGTARASKLSLEAER